MGRRSREVPCTRLTSAGVTCSAAAVVVVVVLKQSRKIKRAGYTARSLAPYTWDTWTLHTLASANSRKSGSNLWIFAFAAQLNSVTLFWMGETERDESVRCSPLPSNSRSNMKNLLVMTFFFCPIGASTAVWLQALPGALNRQIYCLDCRQSIYIRSLKPGEAAQEPDTHTGTKACHQSSLDIIIRLDICFFAPPAAASFPPPLRRSADDP